MQQLPPHVATADEPIPAYRAPYDVPDMLTVTPLGVMLAELAHLYDDDVSYLDQFTTYVAETGCNLIAHYCRDGELVLTAGYPCDAQSRHRNRWMHYLIADLRKVDRREDLLLRRLIDLHRFWDERPTDPRETTRAVRDFLRSGGRILIEPDGKLSEGGGLPRSFTHGSDDEAVECLRASKAYYAVKRRWRSDLHIKRAVRMLGSKTPHGWQVLEARP